MEKKEMGGACSSYGGEESYVQGFGGQTWGKETTLEDLGFDGKIILKWICRKLDVIHGLGSCGTGQEQVVGCNEHVVSVKCGEILG